MYTQVSEIIFFLSVNQHKINRFLIQKITLAVFMGKDLFILLFWCFVINPTRRLNRLEKVHSGHLDTTRVQLSHSIE